MTLRRLALALLLVVWASSGSVPCALVFAQADRDDPSAVPAELPIVVAIEVVGARRYRPEQLVAALGHPLGVPLDPVIVSEGQETLWRAFLTRTNSITYEEVEGGVKLILDVYEIPFDLEPRFVGNDKISTKELLEWAGLEERGEIYHHQVARVARRILEGYKADGYHFATVETLLGDPTAPDGEIATGTEPEAIDVIFRIQEGPLVRVSEVVIEGNESLPDYGFAFWKGGLRHLARVQLKGPHFFNWFGVRFVEQELEADLVALRNVYRDKGFLDAVVDLHKLEFNEWRTRVVPHILVDEGEPYTVSTIEIRGVRLSEGPDGEAIETEEPLYFDEAILKGECELVPGARYELGVQRLDANRLREYYGERGYLSHPSLREDNWEFLEPERRYDVENKRVEVVYRIAQGRKRFIREVMFAGASHTRDRVLRSEVTQLEGKPADIRKITRSLQRIRGSNFFSDPTKPLEHQDPIYRFKPTDDPDYVDLEYIVDEGRVVDFQIAGGIDSNNGAFGLISLSMRNFDITDWPNSVFGAFGEIYRKDAFHGAGQQLDVQISPGSQINYSRVRFIEPDLFRRHFDRISLDLEWSTRERLFDIYDEDRTLRRVRIGRRLTPDSTLFFGYLNSDVEVTELNGGGLSNLLDPDATDLPGPLIRQQAEGEQNFNALTLDYTINKLDNRNNPREGWSLGVSNSWYDDFVSSDAEFFKSSINFDWYGQVGSAAKEVRQGIHLSFGAGVADPHGDSVEVPFTERFFLGGFRTLRGYDFRGVGPNTGGSAIGGETFVNGSVEYRFPVHVVQQPGTFREIEMFRIVPFFDWGILGTESFNLDWDDIRMSAGVGFGLAHPFPVIFNFGFPLNLGEGDDRQVFSFNLAFQ